jgi:type VI secretion system protein ImpA
MEILGVPIEAIPITGASPPDSADRTPRFSTSDYRQALRLQDVTDAEQRRRFIAGGAVDMDRFESARVKTTAGSFRNRIEDVQQCLEELERLSAVVIEKTTSPAESAAPDAGDASQPAAAPAAPPVELPTTKAREALNGCLERLKTLGEDKLKAPPEVKAPADGPEQAQRGGAPPGPSGPTGEITTRDDALRVLNHVADFFRKRDKQSIIAYSLQQVIERAKMELPELMSELIEDDKARKAFSQRSGVPQQAKKAEEKPKGGQGG